MDFGLGFVTHPMLEALLGGGKTGAQQRRRLTKRGWLPLAPMLRTDRDQLAIYPEFGLSALVIAAHSPRALSLPVEQAAEQAAQLYSSRAFKRLSATLADAMREVGSRDVVELTRLSMQMDASALVEWRDEVQEVAQRLAGLVQVQSTPARVTATREGYVVEMFDGASESHLLHDAPTALSVGAWVVRDRVRVASAVRDFLLPVPEPEAMDLLVGPADTEGALDGDEMAEALFGGMSVSEVRRVPILAAAREPEPVSFALDVDVPWHLLAGANTMTRGSRQT